MTAEVLVMAICMEGVLEHSVQVQFGMAQRDDLTVTFTESASSRAAQEQAALPRGARGGAIPQRRGTLSQWPPRIPHRAAGAA